MSFIQKRYKNKETEPDVVNLFKFTCSIRRYKSEPNIERLKDKKVENLIRRNPGTAIRCSKIYERVYLTSSKFVYHRKSKATSHPGQ